jgi:hypothetical protein
MKVILDLKNSFNNYEWDDVKELKDFIDNYMLDTLWKFYDKNNLESGSDLLTDEEINKLYDILDMFSNYEIKECD